MNWESAPVVEDAPAGAQRAPRWENAPLVEDAAPVSKPPASPRWENAPLVEDAPKTATPPRWENAPLADPQAVDPQTRTQAQPRWASAPLVGESAAAPEPSDRELGLNQWIQQRTPRNYLPADANEQQINEAMTHEATQRPPESLMPSDPAARSSVEDRLKQRLFWTPKPQQGIGEEAGNFAARVADSQGVAMGGVAQLAGRGMQAIGLDSAGKALQEGGRHFADASRQYIDAHDASPNRASLNPIAQGAGDVAAVISGGELGKAAGGVVGRLLPEAGTEAATQIAQRTAQTVGQRVGLGLVGGAQAAGNTKDQVYRTLRERGVDEENAQHISDLAGGGMGVVGALTGQLFAGGAPAKTISGRILQSILAGGTASGLHAAAGEAVNSAATGQKYNWRGPVYSSLVGAAAGGAFGAVGEASNAWKNLRDYYASRAAYAKTGADAAAAAREADDFADDLRGAKARQQPRGQGQPGNAADQDGKPNDPYADFRREQEQQRQYRQQSEQASQQRTNNTAPTMSQQETAARATLGLSPDGELYADDVARAFRKAALKSHPDAGGSDAAIKEVISARRVLDRLYGSKVRPAAASNGTQADVGQAGAARPRWESAPEVNPQATSPQSADVTRPAANTETPSRPTAPASPSVPPMTPAWHPARGYDLAAASPLLNDGVFPGGSHDPHVQTWQKGETRTVAGKGGPWTITRGSNEVGQPVISHFQQGAMAPALPGTAQVRPQAPSPVLSPEPAPAPPPRNPISGASGRTGSLTLNSGDHPVQYMAVEADDLLPSHDARRGFARNAGGDLNERPYEDSDQGASSRATVYRIAQSPKPELLTSDTPSAIDGPPVVDSAGRVLGGNARTMGMQLAYSQSGPHGVAIRQGMIDAASKFGIDPAAVSAMKNPVIVRKVDQAGKPGEMSRALNEPLTTGRTAATDATSRAAKVSDSTAQLISSLLDGDHGDDVSLSDVLNHPASSAKVISAFVRDGVLSQRDVDGMTDPRTGALNDQGRLTIQNTLLGRLVSGGGGDRSAASILSKVPAKVKQKLMSAMGSLTRGMAAEPQLGAAIRTALEAFPDYQHSGLTPGDYFHNQQAILPPPGFGDHRVSVLTAAMDRLGPRQFKAAAGELLDRIGAGDGGRFGFATSDRAGSLDEALRETFGGAMSGKAGDNDGGLFRASVGAPRWEKAPIFDEATGNLVDLAKGPDHDSGNGRAEEQSAKPRGSESASDNTRPRAGDEDRGSARGSVANSAMAMGEGERSPEADDVHRAILQHAPIGSKVERVGADQWLIRHHDGSQTPVNFVDKMPVVDRRALAASIITHAAGIPIEHEGRSITIPDSEREFARMSKEDQDAILKIPVRGTFNPNNGEISISKQAGSLSELHDTVREELAHAAYNRLNAPDKSGIERYFADMSPIRAEEHAIAIISNTPRTQWPTRIYHILDRLLDSSVFRSDSGYRPAPPPGPNDARGALRAAVNFRLPNLHDIQAFVGELRRLRERFSVIEAKDGPAVATGFIKTLQAPTEANTLYRIFERQAFKSAANPEQTAKDFLALGYHYRAQVLNQQGKPAAGVPTLTAGELRRIQSDPGVQNAIKVWNREIAPFIQDIRLRRGMPMSAAASSVPLFLNLARESSAIGSTDTGVNTAQAFSRAASGENDYKAEPKEALTAIIRGHLATDAVADLQTAIRSISISKTQVRDPLGIKDPTKWQKPKASYPFIGKYKRGETEVGAIDLSPDADKPEMHYVPLRVAKNWNELEQKVHEGDTLVDKALNSSTAMSLVGDFAPHTRRVLGAVGARLGQAGYSAASILPSWLGSNEQALVRMHTMGRAPIGDAMQLLVDRAGADRGAGYIMAQPHSALGKALNLPHEALFNPDMGVDPTARRVVADAHLRMMLGNAYMNRVEKDLAAGTITATDAASGIERRIGPKELIALGRRVNATLGFANRQTRSEAINWSQRMAPFISSESGMIPDEIRRLVTGNIDPRIIGRSLQGGRYRDALLQLAGMLGSGAIGAYLLMQGLNYANTKMQTGAGRFMGDNDEGHKLDVFLAHGKSGDWYLSNLDPGLGRAVRLLGLKAAANMERGARDVSGWAHTTGREVINESASMLNSAIRFVFSLSGKNMHITNRDRLQDARGGDGYPLGIGRNTAHAIMQGTPKGPALAADSASTLLGAQVEKSSGKNYTPAERLAHDITVENNDRELKPEEIQRHAARADILQRMRDNPAKTESILYEATLKRIIPDTATERKELRDEAKLNPLQAWVKEMKPEDAMKVWQAASPKEQDQLRAMLLSKITDSKHLSDDDQDHMLAEAGIEKPVDLDLRREYRELNAKKIEQDKAIKDGRRSERMEPQDIARYNQLRSASEMIRLYRTSKRMSQDEIEQKVKAVVERFTKKAAA